MPTTATAHEPTFTDTPRRSQAECSCGWYSPWVPTPEAAEAAFDQHVND